MKQLQCLLMIIYSLIANSSLAQYSDCKEYGFKGDIKKATTYNYRYLEDENGKPITSEWALLNIETFYVDKNQNFTKIEVKEFVNDTIKVFTYKFQFENNQKVGYKRFDENQNFMDEAKIEWLNDKAYLTKIHLKIKDYEYFLEKKDLLNNEYRNIMGEQIVYYMDEGKRSILDKYSYQFIFDQNGAPEKFEVFDEEGNLMLIYEYKAYKKDKLGNAIEFSSLRKREIGEKSKNFYTPSTYSKREFEYYE